MGTSLIALRINFYASIPKLEKEEQIGKDTHTNNPDAVRFVSFTHHRKSHKLET